MSKKGTLFTENMTANECFKTFSRSFEDPGAIKSDFQSETVITNKKSNSKMIFGKMLASAAILGCTSAVNLNTENGIEATV